MPLTAPGLRALRGFLFVPRRGVQPRPTHMRSANEPKYQRFLGGACFAGAGAGGGAAFLDAFFAGAAAGAGTGAGAAFFAEVLVAFFAGAAAFAGAVLAGAAAFAGAFLAAFLAAGVGGSTAAGALAAHSPSV